MFAPNAAVTADPTRTDRHRWRCVEFSACARRAPLRGRGCTWWDDGPTHLFEHGDEVGAEPLVNDLPVLIELERDGGIGGDRSSGRLRGKIHGPRWGPSKCCHVTTFFPSATIHLSSLCRPQMPSSPATCATAGSTTPSTTGRSVPSRPVPAVERCRTSTAPPATSTTKPPRPRKPTRRHPSRMPPHRHPLRRRHRLGTPHQHRQRHCRLTACNPGVSNPGPKPEVLGNARGEVSAWGVVSGDSATATRAAGWTGSPLRRRQPNWSNQVGFQLSRGFRARCSSRAASKSSPNSSYLRRRASNSRRNCSAVRSSLGTAALSSNCSLLTCLLGSMVARSTLSRGVGGAPNRNTERPRVGRRSAHLSACRSRLERAVGGHARQRDDCR